MKRKLNVFNLCMVKHCKVILINQIRILFDIQSIEKKSILGVNVWVFLEWGGGNVFFSSTVIPSTGWANSLPFPLSPSLTLSAAQKKTHLRQILLHPSVAVLTRTALCNNCFKKCIKLFLFLLKYCFSSFSWNVTCCVCVLTVLQNLIWKICRNFFGKLALCNFLSCPFS